MAAFRQCRQQAPDVPVIVLSAAADEQTAIQAMQAGAQDYLVTGEEGWNSIGRAIRYAIERQQIQSLLRASARRFRAMIEHSADCIMLLNEKGDILYESPASARILGYSIHSPFTDNIYQYLHPDDIEEIAVRLFAQCLEQPEKPLTCEVRARHQDGSWRWLGVTITNQLHNPDVQAIVVNYRDITTRKQAELERLQSEAQYRAVIETSGDGFLTLDLEGRILEVNEAYVRQSGYSRSELLQMTAADLIVDGTPQIARERLRRIQRAGSLLYHSRHRKKNGLPWDVEISASYWPINEGRIFLFARDLRRRERSEALLRSRLRFSELALRGSAAEIIRAALDDAELYTQSTAGVFYEFEPGRFGPIRQVFSTNVLQTSPRSEDRNRLFASAQAAAWKTCLQTQAPVVWNGPACWGGASPSAQGQTPLARLMMVPILRDGIVRAMIGVGNKPEDYTEEDVSAMQELVSLMMDVLARKRAEDALKERERHLQAILHAALDGFLLTDTAGNFLEVNPAYCEMSGYSREELLKMRIADTNALETEAETAARIQSIIQQGRARFETRHRRKDGSIFDVEVSVNYLDLDGGQLVCFYRDITRRKQIEAELRESRARLQLALAASQTGVWEYDLRSERLMASEEGCRIFGMDCSEENVQAFLARIHPQDREVLWHAYNLALQEQTARTEEFRVVCPDGEVRWVAGLGVADCDENGQPVRLIGTVTDITTRKQAEIERQTLLEIMQGLVVAEDLSQFLELVHRSIARVIYAENFFVALYDEATGLFYEAYGVDQCDEPFPSAVLEKSIVAYVFRTGQPLRLGPEQFDALRASGEVELVGTKMGSWLGAPLKTSRGVIGVMAVQDYGEPDRYSPHDVDFFITIAGQVALAVERKRAEAEVKLLNRRLELILNSVGEGIYGVDAQGRVIFTNAEMARLLGREPDSLLGQNMHALCHPSYPDGRPYPQENCPMARAVLENKVAHGDDEVFFRKDGSSFPVEYTCTPIYEGGQVIGSVVVVRDITEQVQAQDSLKQLFDRLQTELEERRHAEEEVRKLNAELEQRVAERTADLRRANAELQRAARAKDEFLANMSHELRTPLNAILTLSESLEEGVYGPLTSRQLRPLNIIAESGRHLLNLINDILDLSKIEAGKLTLQLVSLEVEPICQACVRMVMQQAVKKNLQVAVKIDPAVKYLNADVRSLKQMLVNLLSNAVKFTPEGGQIGLIVEGDPVKCVARFTVWDTGIGIDPEQAQRLFRPFVQIDSGLTRQYEGTGLGLALVYRMAELHHGGVSLESTPGRGSRFTLALPWEGPDSPHLQELEGPQPGQERLNGAQARSIHRQRQPVILLAEDNLTSQTTFTDYLSAKGYQVIVASSGIEALALARESRVDLILMDVQMPGMDGLEAMRRLRALAELRTIPIVALTALAMPGDRERCLNAGANAYLTKPVSMKSLLETIEALMGEETDGANCSDR